MRYFRLTDQIDFKDRWYLGDVSGLDGWELLAGRMPDDPLEVVDLEVERDGAAMDFTLTEGFALPVVSAKLRKVLGDLGGARFVEAKFASKSARGSYFIMLIESKVDCVDESQSEFEKFAPDDPVRPDLAGAYKGFFKLVVDKTKAAASGRSVFRIARYGVAIVVSADVKQAMVAAQCSGIVFDEV